MKLHKTTTHFITVFALLCSFGMFSLATPVITHAAAATSSETDKQAEKKKDHKKKKAAKVTTKTVTQTSTVPFTTNNQNDATLAQGQTKIIQAGQNGKESKTYKITYTNGKQTKKTLVKTKVTKAAKPKIVAIGTYVAPAPAPAPQAAPAATEQAASGCDPNYAGACVPIASDVDCAGGSGNGPAYVSGPVRVIGTDIYRLDGNGDGVGCE